MTRKLVIGCEEWCSFPELNLPAIKARVDSGAKTSALHAQNIQPFHKEGELWVSFHVHPVQSSRKILISCQAKVVDRRTIRSSTGSSERRYVVLTHMELGGETFEVELTLTNRDSMGYRMLLGREAMAGRMIVDPDVSFKMSEVTTEQLSGLYKVKPSKRNGLKIAVLASQPDQFSVVRLLEAGEQRGHDIDFLSVRDCYLKMDAFQPEILYRGGRILPHYDAVIPRFPSSMTDYGCALLRQFAVLGSFCLNSASAIAQTRDKLHALHLLLLRGIEMPASGFANSPSDASLDVLEMVGGTPLVIKLLEDNQNKGVILAETQAASEAAITALKYSRANVLVQQYITNTSGRDFRCFVLNGKVVAALKRSVSESEFSADLNVGRESKAAKISTDERKMVVKAAKALNLKSAEVDFVRSAKGPQILDVKSSPDIKTLESLTDLDTAALMIGAIEKKLHWHAAEEAK